MPKHQIQIASDLTLDERAATQTFGMIARKEGGKRLWTKTPIATPTGWTTMGDLRVGDTIFDEMGQPTTVTYVSDIETAPSYRMIFSDGEVIVADPEHLWLTLDFATRKRCCEQKGVKANLAWSASRPQCRQSEFTKPRVRTTLEIRNTLTVLQGNQVARNHAVPNARPLELPTCELPIDPYVLGVWLGDGTTAAGSFTTADAEVVEEIERLGYEVRRQPSQVSGKACGFGVLGLKVQLRAAGLLGAKAIPKLYLRASFEQRLALLQGLMDTDGGWTASQAEIALSDRDLADGVYELIVSLGMKATRDVRVPMLNDKICKPSYRSKFSPTLQVFRLSRKARRFRRDTQQQERRTHRYIVGVEPHDAVPMRCISVSSESHLYLAGRGMIPTHNTYLAGKLVEELCRIECPVIIIDPVGNWWGITVAANGKDPGLPFVVLGGEHGDIELSPEGGAVVAELVIARNLNVVLDVSSFSKTNMRRFVADFCERFFEKSKTKRQARMVVFEEAQRFAPQQFKGQERMLGAVEDIVRLGRNYGFGCMLISQRPQSVNKEVLSQVECLFVGQISETHARKALLAWIVEKDEDLVSRVDELASLERGQFFCWSPSWLRTFKKIRVLPKWTFDASSTPGIGEASSQIGPPIGRLSSAELDALREAMQVVRQPSGTDAKTKAALEQERGLRLAAEEEAGRLRQGLARKDEQLGKVRLGLRDLFDRLLGIARDMELIPSASGAGEGASIVKAPAPVVPPRAPVAATPRPQPVMTPRALPRDQVPSSLGKCAKAILTVLVQQGEPLSKATVALMSGYSVNSSSFHNALSELRTAGCIDGRDLIFATPHGQQVLGPYTPLPTGGALFDYWLAHPRIKKCERTLLTALRDNASDGLDKESLAQCTEYSVNSSSFHNALSTLRTLGLIEGRATIILSPKLR